MPPEVSRPAPWTGRDDYRTVLGREYKPMVALVGPQAGAVAHLTRKGAEATLCGIPKSELSPYEDLDEPVCPDCIEWHWRVVHAEGGLLKSPAPSPQ